MQGPAGEWAMPKATQMSCHDRSPMSYQVRLFFGIGILFLAMTLACAAGLLVTSCHDNKPQRSVGSGGSQETL